MHEGHKSAIIHPQKKLNEYAIVKLNGKPMSIFKVLDAQPT